ncbi:MULTISPECIES: hypothetical protein [unclassified Roseofilum]|uniref:hypothetical protein n=1 Tax=unclassified Roseofilum TaxID=2620099 RepID=UPI000E85C2D6|nr:MULTISPECIES: hypothetical protein [unclassified Roseofilum]MBP0008774.1 restriction endonuclease [Roseofilum sp. Belize Diploria]MBP0032271.1 restriction endonuclease [Roseofilum sp. Belize BBD 4]HBQ99318.1 hypothetical protein [Cyanobacteria bacterium UBA11691]
MKIIKREQLLSFPDIEQQSFYQQSKQQVQEAIQQVEWPENSGQLTIYPESGKKRGQGNGVKPIKFKFIEYLKAQNWQIEYEISPELGKVDAVFSQAGQAIAVEWETGNISSSHRSINKIVLGIQKRSIIAGFVVVPCRNLAQYLTDRIGNFEELEPYFDFWRNCGACYQGSLLIFGVEHDRTSYEVPRIPKGTDGRAKA